MTTAIVINWPVVLFWAALTFMLGGMALSFLLPERSSHMGWGGETPGCLGIAVFLLGLAMALVVVGLWLAGAYSTEVPHV